MSEITTYKYYAGNKWYQPSSGQYFESEDPSNGKVWAKLPDCNEVDINIAVKSAKKAYYEGCLLYTSPSPRD